MGHIRTISRPGRAAMLAAALVATLALGGCGGVEFQGKVFDYMGISGDRKEPDPRMAERPPLLLPPNLKTLPQPGNGVAVATAREDWPRNPEAVQKEVVKAKEDAKAEDRAEVDPVNPLKGKNNPLIEKWLSKKKEPEQVDDVPEPDPSTDKPPEGQGVAQAKPKPLTPRQLPEATPPAEDPFHPAAPESYKNPTAIY